MIQKGFVLFVGMLALGLGGVTAQANDVKIRFPKVLDCEAPLTRDSSFRQPFRIYTRLNGIEQWTDITSVGTRVLWSDREGPKPFGDEVASTWASNPYFGAQVSVAEYVYSTMSSQSTDFVFSFRTKEIFSYLHQVPTAKRVRGNLKVYGRDTVEEDVGLVCAARY